MFFFCGEDGATPSCLVGKLVCGGHCLGLLRSFPRDGKQGQRLHSWVGMGRIVLGLRMRRVEIFRVVEVYCVVGELFRC